MKYKLTTYCSKSVLRSIRDFLKSIMEEHPHIAEIDRNMIILAVDEVCANLIIHSHDCDEKENFSLEVMIEPTRMIIQIVDRGDGFNITKYKPPVIDDLIDERRNGGLGLILVKKIMNHVECTKHKDQHVYKLVKIFG